MSHTSRILLALFALWLVGVLTIELWLIIVAWRKRRLRRAIEGAADRAEELGEVPVLDSEAGPYRTGRR